MTNRRSDAIHPAIEIELAIMDYGLIQSNVIVDREIVALLATKEIRDRRAKAATKIASFSNTSDSVAGTATSTDSPP